MSFSIAKVIRRAASRFVPSFRSPRDASNRDWQAEIDRIQWYHDFDFANGLQARSKIENVEGIRHTWRFIEGQLDRLDFQQRSVLEIGAWDGYWSFYAERRGASLVLATDDITQNWASGGGLPLARELLKSKILINQNLPIYELASMNQKFDVILCLGVFYHLRDPFYAFAQIRHCCHPNTILVMEGELAWNGVSENEVRYFYNNWLEFLPSRSALDGLLKSAYLRIDSEVWLHPFPAEPSEHAPLQSDRALMICRPFTGPNEVYVYKPHFGLHTYDNRFSQSK